jgi:polysaccharide deacetylase family protein (PEP-CTERM system associated)
VERNVDTLLDLLDETGTKATCFILGWIAERFPQVVRAIHTRGHEIASHGYGHQLIGSQTRAAFSADIRRSKGLLEDLSGTKVLGYRAPSFSITRETPWALEELAVAGFLYDSSIFPARRDNGGILDSAKAPYRVATPAGALVEFPITVTRMFGRDICFFGGGYLRLFPYWLIHAMAERVHQQGRPVIYYVHPREIDPGHPRLSMSPVNKFKTYVNLATTRQKLIAILRKSQLVTFAAWLRMRPDLAGTLAPAHVGVAGQLDSTVTFK